MHKKRKSIYKKAEYFQTKIGKFLCREHLKIPDSENTINRGRAKQLGKHAVLLLAGGLATSTNTRNKRDIYNF